MFKQILVSILAIAVLASSTVPVYSARIGSAPPPPRGMHKPPPPRTGKKPGTQNHHEDRDDHKGDRKDHDKDKDHGGTPPPAPPPSR